MAGAPKNGAEEKAGHFGRDDSVRNCTTQGHRLEVRSAKTKSRAKALSAAGVNGTTEVVPSRFD
jgi:hypothetical protein